MGVGLVIRHVLPLRNLVITGEEAFVVFTTYGLAFSLIASASTVIRRRDTIILILAATVIWGVFVESNKNLGMVRYITFAALITVGVAVGRRLSGYHAAAARVAMTAAAPAVLCGAGGLLYYGLLGAFRPAVIDLGRGWAFGLSWGLSLGLAVGFGVATGCEIVECIVRRADKGTR